MKLFQMKFTQRALELLLDSLNNSLVDLTSLPDESVDDKIRSLIQEYIELRNKIDKISRELGY